MATAPSSIRAIGTMVAYGFADLPLTSDLAVATRLGASVLEIFPNWRSLPDPKRLRSQVVDAGFQTHSAHGCWGGQTIRAARVDLADLDPGRHRASVDDLATCLDWLNEAGGTCLVVHPGGVSSPENFEARRAALGRGLEALADHARGTGLVVCVENMPPGVHPGSRMADLASLLAELARPELALALDTGHAHLSADVTGETLAAGAFLKTTHVHENDGRQDSHLVPGLGLIDWSSWADSLDAIGYAGPIMLECIRELRKGPESVTAGLLDMLRRATGRSGFEGS